MSNSSMVHGVLLRFLLVFLIGFISTWSQPAMAEVYACMPQDAARLVSSRIGGSMSSVSTGYNVTGKMSGMQVAINFSANGQCSANVDVSVDTSQGWNAEAHAAEIMSELSNSVASVLRSCSNSKCLTAEAEAKQQAEAARAEKVKAAIANYRSTCVEHVEAILQSDSRAISQVYVQNEIASCSKAEALVLKDNYGTSDAEREQFIADTRHVETLFKQIKSLQNILNLMTKCITAPPGTSWSGRGANIKMLVQWTSNDELFRIASEIASTGESCINLGLILKEDVRFMYETFPSLFDSLPNGAPFSDLVYYLDAKLAAAEILYPKVNEAKAWDNAHCTKVCRCSANGQEVTVAWGSPCPQMGQYGCQEWNDAHDRWDSASWEYVRKDCR